MFKLYKTLKQLNRESRDKDTFIISGKDYSKIIIDNLINNNLIEKIKDCSTFDTWGYIIEVKYNGKHYIKYIINKSLSFILRSIITPILVSALTTILINKII